MKLAVTFLLASWAVGSVQGAAHEMVAEPIIASLGETIPTEYMDGNATLLGHLAMPEMDDTMTGKPAIIIIPDWDGVNEYEQMRAAMIAAEWGYVGFAADIYGADLQFVEDTAERGQLASFYRSNPDVFGSRIRTAVEYVKSLPEVDATKVALFGYCFGGTGVLQYGMYGNNDVNSIVSFHGGLSFLPEEPLEFGPKLLVLSGGDDDAVTDVMDLEITLDGANATWEITRFSGIEHAFTVFDDARYNEFVDMRSWESAYTFIQESFGLMEYTTNQPERSDTMAVEYIDAMDGKALMGHIAIPSEEWARPLPAIVVLPDWTGADEYEKERATALAEIGYVAMVADIFGADKQSVESVEERVALITEYGSNPQLFSSRISNAIEQLKDIADVDTDNMGMIGYCFGGTGAVVYSFFSGADMKIAVAFHGSFSAFPPVVVDEISPYLLILSGGDDGLHGNQTIMEDAFNSGNADWEITRYSGVDHGYTDWYGPAYNLHADARSWESMTTAFHKALAVPKLVHDENSTIMPSMDADDGDVEQLLDGSFCLSILIATTTTLSMSMFGLF